MTTTVVVVLDPAPEQALACLSALAACPEEPAFEVVIVDHATVGLEPLLAGLAGDVRIVRLEQPAGRAAALLAGIEAATTPQLVVLDGAAVPEPAFLATLLAGPLPATAAAATPVAAHAVAFAREQLRPEALRGAPDALAFAALVSALPPAHVSTAQVAPAARPAPHPPGGAPELSIVIPTLDAAGDRTRRCVRAIQRATPVSHEIVLVDNGSPPQGFSAPVNAGLRAARGAYAVVCNDDVEVLPGWWEPLRAALSDPADPAAVAFPLTIDGAMREDFAAWCFAVSRDTLDQHGVAPGEFLHPDLKVWYQDTDLLHRLRRAGNPPRLVPASRIRHGLSETVGTTDPALRAWIDAQIRADKQRFELLHGAGVPGAAN